MLVLTIHSKETSGRRESVKIIDKETDEVIAIRSVKASKHQATLGFQASNRFQIKRFEEGSIEDPYNNVSENPASHITQDYEKLKKIRKILANLEMGQEWDNPISQAYLNIAKIIDNE